jgi:hypothetical protein
MVCDPSGMFSDPSDHLSTKEDVLQSKIGYHHSQCAGIRVASGTLQQGGGGEIVLVVTSRVLRVSLSWQQRH